MYVSHSRTLGKSCVKSHRCLAHFDRCHSILMFCTDPLVLVEVVNHEVVPQDENVEQGEPKQEPYVSSHLSKKDRQGVNEVLIVALDILAKVENSLGEILQK